MTRCILQEFLRYHPKRNDGIHRERTTTSIATVDARVAFLMCWLVSRGKRGGHQREEYGEKYRKMLKTVTMQVIGNGKRFV